MLILNEAIIVINKKINGSHAHLLLDVCSYITGPILLG